MPRPLRVCALVLFAIGCKVEPYDATGKPCDAAHPCPGALACVVGVCGHPCALPVESCSGTPCVSTLAGRRSAGLIDGPPELARFRSPTQLLLLPEGVLLVADTGNHAVRAVPLDGGAVTTVAGNGACDLNDTSSICGPQGLARGPNGELYVASNGTDSVHVVVQGQATRFAGDGTPNGLTRVHSVVVAGNRLITSDSSHCAIKFYELDGGPAVADLNPCSNGVDGHQVVSVDYFTLSPDSKTLYFNDGEQQLLTLPLSQGLPNGAMHVLAGQYYGFTDGALTDATFFNPQGMAADDQGLYVADQGNHKLRSVKLGGPVSTLAGLQTTQGLSDGPASGPGAAMLSNPAGIAVSGGVIYFTSPDDGRIRKLENGQVTTLAGGAPAALADGCASDVDLASPEGIELDPSNGNLYFSDTLHHAIRVLSPDGIVTTLAGGVPGSLDGDFSVARFNAPRGLRLSGGKLWVADTGNGKIRAMDLSARTVSTPVGAARDATFVLPDCGPSLDNPPITAQLCAPKAIVADTDGTLYFTDSAEPGQGVIAKLSPMGQLSSVYTEWFFPRGLALTAGVLTVANAGDEQIDRFSTAGAKLSPLLTADDCGKGAHWEYYCEPNDVAASGGDLYALYGDSATLRRRSTDGGVPEVVAGVPFTRGATDGTAGTMFDEPHALAVGADGTLYVADTGNHRIRKVRP